VSSAFTGFTVQHLGNSRIQNGVSARLLGAMAGSKIDQKAILGAWGLEAAILRVRNNLQHSGRRKSRSTRARFEEQQENATLNLAMLILMLPTPAKLSRPMDKRKVTKVLLNAGSSQFESGFAERDMPGQESTDRFIKVAAGKPA
jgi:hypothetical protein